MKKKLVKKNGSVVVDAKGKKELSYADVAEVAEFARKTKAKQAQIIIGPDTEVPENTLAFAAESRVEITKPDNETEDESS